MRPELASLSLALDMLPRQCHLPKIQALKELFPDSYRETPVLVAAVPSAR